MQTAESITEVRQAVATARREGRSIGCVMTMGALHAGHRSLLGAAVGRCDFTVATIFVNPTQFAPGEDFERYPRTLAEDLAACEGEGADLVFHPPVDELYLPGADTRVTLERTTAPLEGRFRPGHFDGVATVVLKLLNIVQPDVAFFGQKDFQQVAVLKRMVADLNVPTEIAVCPILRDPDGLAMSSRNRYLSTDDRQAALAIPRSLAAAADALHAGETDIAAVRQRMWSRMTTDPAVTVQYASVADARTLEELSSPRPQMVVSAAAVVGSTRLIDNVLVELPDPGEESP